MATRSELRRARHRLRDAWERYHQSARDSWQPPDGLRPEILTSWDRSAARVPTAVAQAPVDDADDVQADWERSPLRVAVTRLESELRSAAEDSDVAVAVSDSAARILWARPGRSMRKRAEGVNFVPGGRWDEASVGTNALDLALRADRAVTVYSAEHFSPCVHDWTCWAAPIHDPRTGEQLGVLDLSTTWQHNSPLGMTTTAALALLVEQALPEQRPHSTADALAVGPPPGALSLRLLGGVEVNLDGVPLLLPRRQLEILTLLALYPDGLRLDALHAHLYGDRPVSLITTKAEVSRLRSAVGTALGSRPYRLCVPVSCDALDVLDLLRAGRIREAASAYRGEPWPGTEAPGLIEFGNVLAVAMREALLARPDPEAVLSYAEAVPYDTEVIERAIGTVDLASSAVLPLLRARLAVAAEL